MITSRDEAEIRALRAAAPDWEAVAGELAEALKEAEPLLREEALIYRPVSATCNCHWSECDHDEDDEATARYAELITVADRVVATLAVYETAKKGEQS